LERVGPRFQVKVRDETEHRLTIQLEIRSAKMEQAESSTAAARKALNANMNGASPDYELPWFVFIPKSQWPSTHERRVEKYRPVFLDDIVGNSETVERLKIIAKDGNMPHVIISGMPGIGKTTSILCLARQLLGSAYKEAVLELNASDERGQAEPIYGCRALTWSWRRHRRGQESNQRIRTEESHIAPRST
jgi:Cdc6-like AAA superfamily ATPase